MKYTCTVEIPLERDECVRLWLDETKFEEWQEGFQYRNWKEGEANQVGSKSDILILQGKQKIELEETILENHLPEYILGKYVHRHMTNTQKTSFKALSPNSTLMTSEVEYTAFHTFAPKFFAWLFPGMFKKQSQKWLDQFKLMAEKYAS